MNISSVDLKYHISNTWQEYTNPNNINYWAVIEFDVEKPTYADPSVYKKIYTECYHLFKQFLTLTVGDDDTWVMHQLESNINYNGKMLAVGFKTKDAYASFILNTERK